MIKLLKCRDIQCGDIVLKTSDRSITNKFIEALSALTLQPSKITHAGVMIDRYNVVEAQSAGLNRNSLMIENKKFNYIVFHPKDKKLASGVGEFAKILFDIHRKQKNIKYNFKGLINYVKKNVGISAIARNWGYEKFSPASTVSMDNKLDIILSGRKSKFFCSQFVVYVFQFVAAQNNLNVTAAFPDSAANTAPVDLLRRLKKSPNFILVGILPAGVR